MNVMEGAIQKLHNAVWVVRLKCDGWVGKSFMRAINQTLPCVVKQGASVCTEEIPHNPTTKFRARGFFWGLFSLILFLFIEF